jgi:hypothetical protein
VTHRHPTVRRLALALAAVLVSSGLLAWAPTPATAKAVEVVDWGSTTAPDQRFRKGCHPYKYRYRIDPPTSEWTLETFLRGPGGKPLGSDYFLAGNDPKAQRAVFEVCGSSTRPGRFTIRSKVTYLDGFDETVVKLPRTRFRITRR